MHIHVYMYMPITKEKVYYVHHCTLVYTLHLSQHDPISELLATHFPSATRKPLPSVESVSMDMTGLRRLVVSHYIIMM